MLLRCFPGLLLCAVAFAKSPEWDRAHELYQRTQYRESLNMLLPIPTKDAATLQLIGQNYFMLGDYKKATDEFEKAIGQNPNSSELYHWQGRAYGRRAETAGPFTAPSYASTARQMFERSVALDPANKEAVNDLFDYYLQAPGFLGGGIQKAEKVAVHIADIDAAEGHYAQAQLDDKRKQYESAEKDLRRAWELAPKQVGRVLDIAMYLAKRGRFKESEEFFETAARMAPNSPSVLFHRAETYIKQRQKLEEARQLLQRYLDCPLTPDDPPREHAEALLKKLGA